MNKYRLRGGILLDETIVADSVDDAVAVFLSVLDSEARHGAYDIVVERVEEMG